jgi:hypothetical protein
VILPPVVIAVNAPFKTIGALILMCLFARRVRVYAEKE